ncbi:MAG: twin-arginine translocation signal domain-containing protein, partial [Acidimicrobiales bacterium]
MTGSETTGERSGRGGGISRRTVLKGGAAVGAAMWAAPVIESMAHSAAASS